MAYTAQLHRLVTAHLTRNSMLSSTYLGLGMAHHRHPFRALANLFQPRATFSRTTTTTSIGVLLAIGGVGGYQLMTQKPIRLDSTGPQMDNYNQLESSAVYIEQGLESDEAEIQGLASVQKLSFGTLAGICTGVFVVKGLRLIAFLFGGTFVFLQYLHSRSLIRINWKNWSDGYESRMSSSGGVVGGRKSKGVVGQFMDFLTSDFQYRSTFLVGFCLGLRM